MGIPNSTPTIHVGVAVIPLDGAGLIATVGHGASRRGPNGHRVRAYAVSTLDDVDLAIVGPVFQPGFPDCGPRSTAHWHVTNIVTGDDGTEGQ